MTYLEYLFKASCERVRAIKAERRGLVHVAAGYRRRSLKLEKLAKLAKLGKVEGHNA
jgi:hypothetical protein